MNTIEISKPKQLYEVAMVVDDGKRVGWLVKGGNFFDMTAVFFVDEENFQKLVKDGRVKYFEWINGQMAIKYTALELYELSFLSDDIPQTLDEYLNKDIVLEKELLLRALSPEDGSYACVTSVRGIAEMEDSSMNCLIDVIIFNNNPKELWCSISEVIDKKMGVWDKMYSIYTSGISEGPIQSRVVCGANYLILSSIPLSVLLELCIPYTER